VAEADASRPPRGDCRARFRARHRFHNGTVSDPTGASIPNAQITLENREHSIHREPLTNTAGERDLGGMARERH